MITFDKEELQKYVDMPELMKPPIRADLVRKVLELGGTTNPELFNEDLAYQHNRTRVARTVAHELDMSDLADINNPAIWSMSAEELMEAWHKRVFLPIKDIIVGTPLWAGIQLKGIEFLPLPGFNSIVAVLMEYERSTDPKFLDLRGDNWIPLGDSNGFEYWVCTGTINSTFLRVSARGTTEHVIPVGTEAHTVDREWVEIYMRWYHRALCER